MHCAVQEQQTLPLICKEPRANAGDSQLCIIADRE